MTLLPPIGGQIFIIQDGGSWRWDGNPAWKVVAERLKSSGIWSTPFGEGISFSIGPTQLLKPTDVLLTIEAGVYEAKRVMAISERDGVGFRASQLMSAPYVFSLDIIIQRHNARPVNAANPLIGPASSDPQELARTFFFTLQGWLDEHEGKVPPLRLKPAGGALPGP